jgi:glycosyltransferase involved in cell wall biosynthesis
MSFPSGCYDCHENYHLQIRYDKPWIPRPLRSGLARVIDALERWCVRALRLCIVPLPEMEERFRHPMVAVITIRNRTAWSPARNLPHGPHVVYSGSIGANYGLNILLGIAREIKKRGLPHKVFITLKNAAPLDQNSLRVSIERDELPIVIREQVPADRIADFLSLGSIGLSIEQDTPEKRHAVPGKLFEYMAFGLPIVTSDIPNNRSIVEQAGCGLVAPAAEPAAYVDAIQRILGDAHMLAYLRENGFRAVETLFSWEQEKDHLIGLYRRLLRCPPERVLIQ